MRHGKDERARGTAAQALLDRGWGKAKVGVAASGGPSYIEALQATSKLIRAEKTDQTVKAYGHVQVTSPD